MLQQIRQPIEEAMQRFEELRMQSLASANPLLDRVLRHVAARQGKMMRPMLALLMASHDTDTLMHAALALELLHTASLVHDDVVDRSEQRRGLASVNAVFDNTVAVLSGDYILSQALVEAAHTRNTGFVEAIARLGKQLADGELLQLHCIGTDDLGDEQYFEVIRRKTASLFALCAAASAILDGGDSAAPYRLGELIGLVFQMRDDMFDVEAADTGKPAGIDLREGKLTLPVLYAVRRDERLLPAAMRVRGGDATADDIAVLTEAACRWGVPYTEHRMAELTDEAHEIVKQTALPDSRQSALHTYIDYVSRRSF